jgi:glycosyltransferase involved in cell wall biosynthesis
MYSTNNNIVIKEPQNNKGLICRKYLKYPDQTGSRKAEGGLRCQDKYKHSLPNKPLISVITVVFNDDKTLTKTIESVLAQTYDNVEYIIIDGGSTDKTLDIIKSYEDFIDYYISESDEGIYSAMNKGLSLAQGDYIGLLNSGDWYEINALSIVSNTGLKNPKTVIAGTQQTLDERYQPIGTIGLRFMDERVYSRMPLSHPGTFVPSEIYEKIGNYAEYSYGIIADWDFFIRCYEQKIKFHGINDILVNYWRVGVSAQSDPKIFEEQVALLNSRFPSIRNYSLLFLLSSNMDEKSDSEIMIALQMHLNQGGVIPEKIMKGVYLYRKQKDSLTYEDWLKSFDQHKLKYVNHEYQFVFESSSIEELIQKGQEEKLPQQQIWLINERGWDAKDNGFVLYAWLKTHHPEINAYYVITQNSLDYKKVVKIDPETIIEYNSEQHKRYYLFSQFVISSQGGDHCHPLSYQYLKTHYPSVFKTQFVFLQHGVLKNSISYFHKGHFNSSLFIISGEMERQLFEIGYQYTPDDIAVTGLCRFDLLKEYHKKLPYIFFMPTWR